MGMNRRDLYLSSPSLLSSFFRRPSGPLAFATRQVDRRARTDLIGNSVAPFPGCKP